MAVWRSQNNSSDRKPILASHYFSLKRKWQDNSGVVSSVITVSRRIDEAGLYGRVAWKKILLTERHKRVQSTWARE